MLISYIDEKCKRGAADHLDLGGGQEVMGLEFQCSMILLYQNSEGAKKERGATWKYKNRSLRS
jgi:hypothetical protein